MTLVVCFLSFHYVLVYLLNFHYVLVYLLNYEFVDVWFLSQLYLKLGPGFNSILVPPLSLLNLNVVRRQHANSNFHDSAGNTKTEAPTQSSPRYKIRTRVPRRGNKKSRVSDTFGRTRNTDRLRTCRHIERG